MFCISSTVIIVPVLPVVTYRRPADAKAGGGVVLLGDGYIRYDYGTYLHLFPLVTVRYSSVALPYRPACWHDAGIPS